MEDSEPRVQLPLPEAAGAQVIKLPVPDKQQREQQPGKHREPLDKPYAAGSPGQRNLWYALFFPQLVELSEVQQEKILQELAALAESVSSTVSFHPQALICEVRSSLKYFGGIDAIHDKLAASIKPALTQQQLQEQFFYAASPTVTGSLLLARSGYNTLVYRKDNLRSALGQLPIEVLQLDEEQNRRLYNMGVRKIRDIWRLPTDGLRKRFGSDFVNLLNKALGTAPEPTRNYVAPPAYNSAYDLPYELEDLDRLLPIADEMLAQLCDFLQRRDLSTSHLVFALLHEKRPGTEIDMALRQSSRCRDHLLLLLETHFAKLNMPAPIIGVKLSIKKFDAFMTHSEQLLIEDRAGGQGNGPSALDQFMEQLHARLGSSSLKSINTVAEHCPEYASEELDYQESRQQSQQQTGTDEIASNPRPVWLLTKPEPLLLRHGKLYHRQPIRLISGPERIETRWWYGSNICRDYYVAQEQNGSRLWIFRERGGGRNWYLHGFFA